MAVVPHDKNWGELGPAMRALPNNRWRAFVEFYVLGTITNTRKDNIGPQAQAARKAGFGGPQTGRKSWRRSVGN
jgi:hypothetical protein